MKTLLLIITILTFNSCGSSSDSGSGSANNPESSKSQTKSGVSTSYYVDSESDLKACDDTSRGNLAYVKATSQFEACLSTGWAVVNVKGSDGANGKDGASGSPVSPNQWYDAVTKQMWVMTNISSSITGWNNSMSACTGDYRMPSPSEILLALTHGMKAAAQAMVGPPTFILANDGNPYTLAAGTQGSSSVAAQFCIAK